MGTISFVLFRKCCILNFGACFYKNLWRSVEMLTSVEMIGSKSFQFIKQ